MPSQSEKKHFSTLFEDKDLIIVNKPAGLLTASDKSGDQTLIEFVRAEHKKTLAPDKKGYLVPIHFLDRPVSGVIMFAKSSKAARRLNEQMQTRRISKLYLALVQGKPSSPQGLLTDHLVKNERKNIVKIATDEQSGSKNSSLRYEVISSQGDLSLLFIQPLTGRSHQIRVQLASRGWPIYGDSKYHSTHQFARNIALHAYRLTIEHPISKQKLSVTAPLPPSWNKLLKIQKTALYALLKDRHEIKLSD